MWVRCYVDWEVDAWNGKCLFDAEALGEEVLKEGALSDVQRRVKPHI